MRKRKFIILFILYLLPLSLGLNLYLRIAKENSQKKYEKGLYKKLKEVGYQKEDFNLYSKANNMEINPQYMFWIPLTQVRRNKISNKYLNFTQEGYRETYPLFKNFSREVESYNCLLILGGSTAFGNGVSSDEKTLASNIQRMVGSETRVFNLAVPSFNSRQELISIINFLNNPKSQKCNKVDSISLTGWNDISIAKKYLKSSLIKNKFDRLSLISTPQSFKSLYDRIEDRDEEKTYRNILGSLYVLTRERLFGELLNTNKSLIKKAKANIMKSSLSQNKIDYVNEQMNGFAKNQLYISTIIKHIGRGSHIVVLQPSLRDKDRFWINANNSMTRVLEKTQSLKVIDLRKYLLELDKDKKPSSIIKEFNKSIDNINRVNINSFYFFDEIHLTDLGTYEVAKEIYKSYSKK